MIKANFNAYNSYVTDSVYQWDINRDLVISGLNLSVAPEIHFTNANMDRAIVRQSALNAGIVTVRIPNSLLQEAITAKAYVGVYEDDTFKVIETIEIPVIAKARPSDYTIEDTDEEIYSFNKLENDIVNAKKEFEKKLDEVENDPLKAYPVDSIYISWSHTSPAELFGGTWERVINPETGEGVFLYGCAESDQIGEFGGEALHTLTIDEMPPHSHGLYYRNTYTGNSSGNAVTNNVGGNSTLQHEGYLYMDNTGGGKAHNNMPPYVNVSVWRRVA